MINEVIFINDDDRKSVTKVQPKTIEEWCDDSLKKEDIEEYVKYRVNFELSIEKVKLTSNRTTKEFGKIVYLGKTNNYDTFVCYNGITWELIYGELNSGLY